MQARDERKLLALVAAALSLQPLSTDLYLPSLPPLAREFGVAPGLVQHTLTVFVIGFGLAQLVAGPLSDRIGRRPVVLGGSLLFTLASVLCAAANSLPTLMVGRGLQALGCCAVVVAARAVVRDRCSPAEGARLLSRASTWLALAPLLGPIVGGQAQQHLGWQAAFALQAVLALGLLLAWRAEFEESNLKMDPEALGPRRLARAYLDVALHAGFRAYALPSALTYGAIFVFIAGSSFAYIDVLGVSSARYGALFSLGVSGYLLGTMLCRALLRRFAVDRVLRAGLALTATGGVGLWACVHAGLGSVAVVLGAQFVVMLAHGINQPCAQASALGPFGARAGTAAGLLGFLTMAVALATGALFAGLQEDSLRPLANLSALVGLLALASGTAITRARGTLGT